MSAHEFDIAKTYRSGLPAAAAKWPGLPRYAFNSGHNDRAAIPCEALAQAAADVLRRDGSKLAVYNLGTGPLGYEGLRDFLSAQLERARDIKSGRDEILITSGSGQGLDLVNNLLLQRGDTVLFEEYSYQGALKKVASIGANVVGVPLDEDGICVERLAAILSELKSRGTTPKYLYTVPTIQNPTGSILTLERRRKLIALAREYEFVIFEDECYADIIWAGGNAPPSLFALAPDIVIHIGSFSKSLAPALRVGYLTARSDVVAQIVALKNDGGTGALDQMVVAEYFSTHFEAHIGALTKVLNRKFEAMVEAVQTEFGTAADLWMPKGGIFLWIKLPDAVDVRTLVQPALKAGVAFNPGPDWAVDPEAAKSWLRLCFALPNEQEIRDGVRELARVSFEHTGIPIRSANVARVAAGKEH